MTDPFKSSVPGSQATHPPRSPSEPLTRNNKGGPAPYNGAVDIIALVRSLQRTAGVSDCFRKGRVHCDDAHCNWRSYCLGKQPEQGAPPKKPQK